MLRTILSVLVILPFSFTAAQAQVIFVNDDATGLNNGASPANAFNDLQLALSTAVSGDEIRVAVGAYMPAPPAGQVQARHYTRKTA